MIAEGLSAPQMLANASNVSTLAQYAQHFDRIFSSLGDKSVMSTILKTEVTEGQTYGAVVDQLMKDRNNLVHEISINDIGHPNIRDYTTLGDAADLGKNVLSFIKHVERKLSEIAPPDFPNLLDSEAFPADTEELLQRRLTEIKEQLTKLATDTSEINFSREAWLSTSQVREQALARSFELIEELQLPGSRYYDVRPYLRRKVFESEITLLKELSRQTAFEEELISETEDE